MSKSGYSPEILVITDSFPPQKGGSVVYNHNILQRIPYETTVLCPFSKMQYEGPYKAVKCFYCSWKFKNVLLRKMHVLLLYLQVFLATIFVLLFRATKPSLIIAMQVLPAGLPALIAAKLWKIPFIVLTHGEEITMGRKKVIHSYLIRKILPAAEAVVTVSNFTKQQLIKFGLDPARIKIVYNAINPSIEPVKTDRLTKLIDRWNLDGSTLILMVGRLMLRKGFDTAITILPEILAEFPDTKLMIVGRGMEKSYLEQLIEDNRLQDSVLMLGDLTDNEVRQAYSMCDLFLLPNRKLPNGDTEGFGVVFIEAGLLGKPVIGGKDGGTGDAILHEVTGLLVDGNNPDEVKSAILRLLGDPAFAEKLGVQGRQRVMKEFTIETQQDRFNTLLREVFANNS